ncbi:transglutaminase-like cysteine peptidase [Desulfovibrio cuneatus]|uniref:transglutaminase-like cysteine peptidase n=1 Tax=Desulfovibrio cuneatus TaxID=159728 RepID=UPI000483650C|nr:transglutaminase-like cysteine peptidase [Desulfovibrio cuneatus]
MARPPATPSTRNHALWGAWVFGILCVLALSCVFPVTGMVAKHASSAKQYMEGEHLHLDAYPALVAPAQQAPGKAVNKKQMREKTQDLSNSPMPLNRYWGVEEKHQYTPEQLLALADAFPSALQLRERYDRLAQVPEDVSHLRETDASFQYALRRIAEKDSLLDKVLVTETLGNQFKYFAEPKHTENGTTQQEDYWMLPSEFLNPKYGGAKGGDCEDFAMYKFGLLLEAGVPAAQMQIVAVYAPTKEGLIGHAVLMVQDPKEHVMYVLDSLRVLGQTPVHYNTTYMPIFAIGPASVSLFASSDTRKP